MRLRNKKTGEIGNLLPYGGGDGKIWVWIDNISRPEYRYNSLAELNEEWEDVPEEYYFINSVGGVIRPSDTTDWEQQDAEYHKEIGNYFETKEEAEKAVKKLEAWKRLKDKGFKFNRWMIPEEPKTPHIKLVIEAEMDVPDSPYDLDTCFGGEDGN